MHSRIVRDHNHKSGVNARVAQREQRICRDVQADVFLSAEGATTCQRRSERRLHSDFLVRCPFAIDVVEFDSLFGYFGRRRAGVTRHERNARLPQAAGKCFVAQHEFFHQRSFLTLELDSRRMIQERAGIVK